MVLARTPDAPAGSKGISLFLIPKLLVNDDGSLGPRNDLRCVSLEHKLGIHASPTCVMSFGDDEGAIGYLVGEEHGGMAAMFTMMNNARLAVGLEGLALAERAYQAALAYARERVQGRRRDGGGEAPARIIEHPDVRRMLLTMRSQIEAMRALAYSARGGARPLAARARPGAPGGGGGPARAADPAGQGLVHRPRLRDRLERAPGPWRHGLHRGDRDRPAPARRPDRDDLRGHQRHPGARSGRPQAAHGGRTAALGAVRRAARTTSRGCAAAEEEDLRRPLAAALGELEEATRWLQAGHGNDADAGAAGATPYLRMLATTLGGFLLARSALAARRAGHPLAASKLASARFYAGQLLPPAAALRAAVTAGSAPLQAALD